MVARAQAVLPAENIVEAYAVNRPFCGDVEGRRKERPVPAPPPPAAVRRSFFRRLVGGLLRWRAELLAVWRSLASARRAALRIMQEHRPVALLVACDRVFGPELPLIKAAGEIGCMTLVVPFAISPKAANALRARRPLHQAEAAPQRTLKRWIRRRHPSQVIDSPQGAVLRYTPVQTLVLSLMRMLPPNPWCMGGGHSDFVAVSGPADRDTRIRDGVPAEKIVVTGETSFDFLFEAAQGKEALIAGIQQAYGLDVGKKRLLCCPPPLLEHHLTGAAEHWEHMHSLAGVLAETGANVLMALHPRCDPADYRWMEDSANVRILEESLRDSLPAADIYVASAESSTVRWAVLLGIPVVCLDFYSPFPHRLYDGFEGIVWVRDRAELPAVLRRLLEDAAHYEAVRRAQLATARRIAVFDGQARRRLIGVIEAHTGPARAARRREETACESC